jgi:hypothetical protein
MGKSSLTTTAAKIIEAEDVVRSYILSVGLFSGADVVYVRRNDVGEADMILSATGTSLARLIIPPGRQVQAWTNLGTAEICYMEEAPR